MYIYICIYILIDMYIYTHIYWNMYTYIRINIYVCIWLMLLLLFCKKQSSIFAGSSMCWNPFFQVIEYRFGSNILFSLFCVCAILFLTKAFLPPLSTRLLCLVVVIPLACWLCICACVYVPLYVHVKMSQCR